MVPVAAELPCSLIEFGSLKGVLGLLKSQTFPSGLPGVCSRPFQLGQCAAATRKTAGGPDALQGGHQVRLTALIARTKVAIDFVWCACWAPGFRPVASLFCWCLFRSSLPCPPPPTLQNQPHLCRCLLQYGEHIKGDAGCTGSSAVLHTGHPDKPSLC